MNALNDYYSETKESEQLMKKRRKKTKTEACISETLGDWIKIHVMGFGRFSSSSVVCHARQIDQRKYKFRENFALSRLLASPCRELYHRQCFMFHCSIMTTFLLIHVQKKCAFFLFSQPVSVVCRAFLFVSR